MIDATKTLNELERKIAEDKHIYPPVRNELINRGNEEAYIVISTLMRLDKICANSAVYSGEFSSMIHDLFKTAITLKNILNQDYPEICSDERLLLRFKEKHRQLMNQLYDKTINDNINV